MVTGYVRAFLCWGSTSTETTYILQDKWKRKYQVLMNSSSQALRPAKSEEAVIMFNLSVFVSLPLAVQNTFFGWSVPLNLLQTYRRRLRVFAAACIYLHVYRVRRRMSRPERNVLPTWSFPISDLSLSDGR